MNWNCYSESPFWFESPEITITWAFPAFFQCFVIKLQFVMSVKSARFLTCMPAKRMQPLLYIWPVRQIIHTFAWLGSWKPRKKRQDTLDSSPEVSTNTSSTGSDLCNTLKWFKFMHKRRLLFQGHCRDNYSSSKQVFQSSPSMPIQQELLQACPVWAARFPSAVPRCPNKQRDTEKVPPPSLWLPSKAIPERTRPYCAKPADL